MGWEDGQKWLGPPQKDVPKEKAIVGFKLMGEFDSTMTTASDYIITFKDNKDDEEYTKYRIEPL